MKNEEKFRVQFDFSPEQVKVLDLLKKKSGATTRAEVIRRALKLFDLFADVDACKL